ncbi:hypothetical protein ES703_50538 [subsurface metagenome]
MTEKIESVEVKNISAENGKKMIELIDEANISVEKIKELINKEKGGKKMTDKKMTGEQYLEKEEENLKKIEKYIEENPGTEYRDAVLFCLDKAELSPAEKKVEEYIEKCKSQGISVTYRQAVLKVLDQSELEEPEKKEE